MPFYNFPAAARVEPRPVSIFNAPAAACLLFAITGAIFVAWPIWRAGLSIEIDRNEPWNAWFVNAVVNGTPLYPEPRELIVNNYPPLSFYFTAFVAKLTGDIIIAGRVLSLVSLLVLSAAAALCIRTLGGSKIIAAFGALWLFATMDHAFIRYVGMNDPNLFALALMGLALAFFLRRLRDGYATEPAIALMVLAGFVKHNIVAIPLSALWWLALTDKRTAARPALFGAALSIIGLLLCVAVFGDNFAAEMLMPREMSTEHTLSTVGKLQWAAPALVIWGVWAWLGWEKSTVRFTALLLGVTLAGGLLQTSGAGVSHNAYFEFFFASAIGVALAFEGVPKRQTAMAVVLVSRLLLSQEVAPYRVLFDASFRNEARLQEAIMDAEAARVKAIPGAVSCSIMTVCYRAGKAFVYDNFWVKQLLAKGYKTKAAVDDVIRDKGIRVEG